MGAADRGRGLVLRIVNDGLAALVVVERGQPVRVVGRVAAERYDRPVRRPVQELERKLDDHPLYPMSDGTGHVLPMIASVVRGRACLNTSCIGAY